MENNEILLANIVRLISRSGISEGKCLRECKIHSNFITNIRNGKLSRPSIWDVNEIAKFFNVNISELITDKGYTDEPRAKIEDEAREARIMLKTINSLDANGRYRVKSAINNEIRRMRMDKKFK